MRSHRPWRLGAIVAMVLVAPLAVSPASGEKLFITAAWANEAYRYDVGPTGPPTLELTLTHASLNAPYDVIFGPGGEMFVVNRGYYGPSPAGYGSLSRFLDPSSAAPVFNGVVSDPGFGSPHGVAVRDAEIFLAQRWTHPVIRFLLGASGTVTFNGVITDGLAYWDSPRGAAVNPRTGELFIAQCCGPDAIVRFLFDGSGDAIPNGVINGNGLSGPHGMHFSPWGELFVANYYAGTVSRFLFDGAGNAIANGVIDSHPGGLYGGLLGVAFSSWGELFVSSEWTPRVYRWTFEGPSREATANGVIETPGPLSELEFFPELEVAIDIKPGSFPNSVNPGSRGLIPVAILTTPDLDASEVEAGTCRFGPIGTEAAAEHWALEDVDHDGDIDLMLHFSTRSSGVVCGIASATLTGSLVGGRPIRGSDSIRTVGCN